ncbi:hypothetical protein [Kitasatospora sp. NPDC098663]|uniref:hypothetical protein n=1 Tax=Kitasatospora sp. NPDC098663 TaxID=3364096 RepID=UPI00380B8511
MKPHQYLTGVSVTALGLGNRLIIRALKPHVKITRQQVGGSIGLGLFFSPVLARPIARYAPTTFTVVLVLWVVVAVAVGNTKAATKLAEADKEAREKAAKEKAAKNEAKADGRKEVSPETEQDEADDQDDDLQDAPADADLYALVRHVAAQSDQGTAAHLPDLLAEGQQRGMFEGWEQTDLKAHLAALGAPLVEGKKLTFGGRQRNRQAVLLEGLPESDPGTVPVVVQKAA